jgi:RNA polymerase sigma-70 factor (ECF subfamily)
MNDLPIVAEDALDPGPLQVVGRRARSDDGDGALEAFVVEHYDRLLRLARLVCHDAVDAADAVQAGLEQAWRHRGGLRDADRRSAWLDRIVVREAIRVGRRRRTWLERILGLDHDADTPLVAGDPSHDLALRLTIGGAFDRLSPEQRAVVALHLHAGYSVAETASIVGAPVETVRSRLRLAREHLRDALGEGRS